MSTPQDKAFELLASKFPKRYQVKNSEFLQGLLRALAEGDGYIQTQVEATRDNLIAVTATGRFLDRAAGRYGIVRGQGTGVLDPDFQQLIPVMGMSPKQISHILLKIIDSFYGPYASHANVTSSAFEPFNLIDGFNLRVMVDGNNYDFSFTANDAVDLSSASALEVATAISAKTNGALIGATVTDTRTGHTFVNIRTKTIGSQGFIQVLGGDAQTVLQFPEVRPASQGIATWDVTRYLGTDEMIYTVDSGVGPGLQAGGVSTGDYVTIRSDSGFAPANTGTYKVTFVGLDFFRLANGDGIIESAVTQNHNDDFVFFRPDLGNVLLSARPAALLETSPRELTIILPVTSPIVKRKLAGGHHFHGAITTITATTSNTVTLTSPQNFPASGAIKPLSSRKNSKGVVSTFTSTTVTLINATNWPTQGAFWSPNLRQFYFYQGRSGNQLQGVTPTPTSDLTGSNISYSDRCAYTSITGNVLNGVYPNPSALLNVEVAAAGAEIIANFPGSFLYDPQAGFIAAENSAILGQTIGQGSVKTLIQVDDVSLWPDQGYFVCEFGTSAQEGPIRYLAKVGKTGLIVDPSHVYVRDHLKGIGIRLVRQIGAYTPRTDGTDLPIYSTSTSPARDLLKTYLQIIAASGVQLRFEIRVPDEKWPVLPNLYATDPLDTTLV